MKTEKKILYVDVPFIGMHGGDKNRSKFLYESLTKEYETDILLICEKEYPSAVLDRHKINKMFFLRAQKPAFYLPSCLYGFNPAQKNVFEEILLENRYDLIFFRFNSTAVLANIAKEVLPFSNVMVDVDMLNSRICYEAWRNNMSVKNRYFLLEYLKLRHFEQKFFKNEFTFLYTNDKEIELVKRVYRIKNIKNHEVLDNVINEVSSISPDCPYDNFILFYGMLNSTVNETAYSYLVNEVYPLIEAALIKTNTKILVVGKNQTSAYHHVPENIEIVGEVDNLSSYIRACKFVFLPLKLASGTLTRILEVSLLKKAVLTTSIAAEGLEMDDCICIEDETQRMASYFSTLLKDKKLCQQKACKAYAHVICHHTQSSVSKKLYEVINKQELKKINVVHIPRRFTKTHWGGTENVVLSHAQGLKDFNIHSEVFTSKILNSKSVEYIDDIKINRFSYFYPYLNLKKEVKEKLDFVGGNIFSFTMLFSLLFKKNIDLIHLHTFKRIGGIARLICKIKKIPYLVSIHGGIYHIKGNEQTSRVESTKNSFEWGKLLGFLVGSRKVIHDSSAVICLNDEEYKNMKEKHARKDVFLLTNSVDVNKFSTKKNSNIRKKYNIGLDKFVCLISGRIDKQKNQLLMLELLNKIKNEYKNIHLLLAGNITDEEYFSKMKKYIYENSLTHRVTMLTDIQPESLDLIDIYLNSDVLILPSVHEPFGIVVLEAWASSLPVIVSDNAGICNRIQHKKDALIFETNSMASLEKNLLMLLSNKRLQTTLTQHASQTVLDFDLKNINCKINSIYRQLLHKQ